MARAQSEVIVDEVILSAINAGDIHTKKGPVFHTAIIAGVMAAKKTADLIPFCHPVALENCKIDIRIVENRIIIESEAVTSGKTGVEMEAITAASVAAITVYDMCKALSHNMVINNTHLIEKTGGKSDFRKD